MIHLFITKRSLLHQHINWWNGVVRITCGLLWCFYQLFGLPFWRHPFTAEDPLMSKWGKATFLQICSDEETNSSTSWIAWGWVHIQQIFIFGWTIKLIKKCIWRDEWNMDRKQYSRFYINLHLSDAFIQSDLQYIQVIHFFISMCVPWELNPQPFAAANAILYHWVTGTIFISMSEVN